jgi:hypothetical protein
MVSGPAPKEHGRRRRSEPVHSWITLPAEGREGPVPPIPEGLELSDAARRWWETVWRTPMATQWLDGDAHALAELAFLKDRFTADSRASMAGEIRLRSEQFGLTPAGRQKLRWRLADPPSVQEVRSTPPSLRRIRAVEDDDIASVPAQDLRARARLIVDPRDGDGLASGT